MFGEKWKNAGNLDYVCCWYKKAAELLAGTRKLADTPTRFHVENMPKSDYIVIPETSSEKRRYVPMGFMPPDVICSNLVKIIPDASFYHFGVLTSNVHMAWMRAVMAAYGFSLKMKESECVAALMKLYQKLTAR